MLPILYNDCVRKPYCRHKGWSSQREACWGERYQHYATCTECTSNRFGVTEAPQGCHVKHAGAPSEINWKSGVYISLAVEEPAALLDTNSYYTRAVLYMQKQKKPSKAKDAK